LRFGAIGLFTFQCTLAQNVTGSILGTVHDSSSAVVAGARVTVTNEGTNFEYRAQTAGSGDYVVPNLPPGIYTVTSESAGFKQNVVRGVALLANRSVRVDFTLEPGAIAQSVEVQAAAPVVNSENATIGNILESGTITTLPLNGRTLDRLIRIPAGVTTDSASNPRVAGSSYWVECSSMSTALPTTISVTVAELTPMPAVWLRCPQSMPSESLRSTPM